MYICVYIYIYIYIYIQLLAREAQPQGLPEQGYHGEKAISMCVCMYACMSVCVYMYKYMYIYIYMSYGDMAIRCFASCQGCGSRQGSRLESRPPKQ